MSHNTQSIAPLLADYRSLELDAHISLDDVIMKVTEENHELQVALRDNNAPEIKSEARDVLINILSASARLIDIDQLDLTEDTNPNSINDTIALWIRQTAMLRWRYSRGNTTTVEYKETVSRLISSLISLIGVSDVSTIVSESISKFRTRIQDYLPDIHLEDFIAAYPDFPKPGILFRDIAPLLANSEALRYAWFEIAKHAKHADVIAGLDARGFIFGTLVAQILGKPFVMIRKKGKLPGETIGTDYSLEYGDNSIEIQKNAIKPGDSVAIIDDLLATGGTLLAASELIEKVWWRVESLVCLIGLNDPELLAISSRKSLDKYKTETILQY
jgi:adenine phosphoribosyltransferase